MASFQEKGWRSPGKYATCPGKMGAVLGVSASTVKRLWQAHGLKLHIVRGMLSPKLETPE